MHLLLVGHSLVLERPQDAAAELGGLASGVPKSRSLDGGTLLSLSDRCYLALAVRSTPAEVLTADRAWADLDLPIRVRLLRWKIAHRWR